MAKIIKKIVRWVFIVVAVLISVSALSVLLLRTPKFQTFIVHRLTEQFSDKLGAHISVGNASYTFFNKLILYDILVKDQNNDTLLAARQVSLKIKELKPTEQKYRFGKIDVYEPDFRMIQDSAGILNLTWYIETLKGDKQKDTTKNITLDFSDINIIDGAYSLINLTDTSIKPDYLIDFSDLRLTQIDAKVENLQISDDTVSMGINDLSFIESKGFRAVSLNMNAVINRDRLYFSNIDLLTDSSIVRAEAINLLPLDSVAYMDFINKVKLNITLDRSKLNTSDLAYFIQPLRDVYEDFYLSGKVSGTVSDIKGRNIELEYSSSTRLECKFDITGLPSPDDIFMFIDIKEVTTCAEDIEKLSLPRKEKLDLPVIVHNMGQIAFNGNFTGFITDFVAFGTLMTDLGSISSDISLKPEGKKDFRFKGLLKAGNVDLGRMTDNNKLFGILGMHANVDGLMRSFKHISANISGLIDSVGINDYKYRNISLSGTYIEKVWDGTVSVNDRNIKMDILGRFDLSDTIPEFDFTMNLAHADLYRLKLEEEDTLFNASALLTATFKGDKIDNLDGDLRLLNSNLTNSNGEITIYDFLIRAGSDKGVPTLVLRSDLADAEVRGKHTYASLGVAGKSLLAGLFPTKFPMPPSQEKLKENNFIFNARIKKLDNISEFLGSGIRISEGSILSGIFMADSSKLTVDFHSSKIGLGSIKFVNLVMTGSVNSGIMKTSIISDTLKLPGRANLENFTVNLGSLPDTLNFDLNWDNLSTQKTSGEIRAIGFYSLNKKLNPVLTVSMLPSEIVMNNAPWKFNPARIVIDSVTTTIDNLLLSTTRKYIKLDGKISPDPQEKMTLSFEGLDLSFINTILQKEEKEGDEDAVEMNFGGILSGGVALSDLKKNFLFESDVIVDDFVVNNTPYGRVNIGSEWDPQRKTAVINVSNNFGGAKFFEINGTYSPSTKQADILASTYRMPLNILNSVVKTFASDVRGVGSGQVRFYGKMSQPLLRGSIKAEDASMKIDFLQTRYSFSDSIRFTKKGIEFRNIRIYDEKQNQGTLNGILAHNSFKDFAIDLNINMNKMMVLNTKPKDNETFYGTAYASGYAGIKSNAEKLTFNISARTEDNTSFYVPLNSSATVSEFPYIIFVDPKVENVTEKNIDNLFTRNEKKSQMELDFDLEVTPEAEVQLIMDSKTGGVIRGTGSGKLNISLNNKGQMKMSGDYVIEDGDYLFTLGNIVNKRFSVEEGGSISWNGDLTDAAVNLKAIYKLKASLFDIYPVDAFRERIPVECQLKLSEKLMNPVIGFDIYLPTADDETREYLKSVINTEEEISRQFLYLLVMNSFYADPSLYTTAPQTTPQGASAIGVTTTEMLSNQLSNWLSQISNDFDVGFNYRPGIDLTPQELEVALSTQILNDKIKLNGNFDVGGKQSNTQASNISGDFDIEFTITEKLKFKVFNRSNDHLFYETAPYTQGFGIFFRRDYNRFKDLFVNPEKKKKKIKTSKEDTAE